MFLLIGLGNPGAKYEKNRHNVGFMAVDEIVRRHDFSHWKSKFQAQIATGTIAGVKTLAIKPTTFMNESGRSAGEATRFHKIELANTLVIYDELDLAPGKVKIKKGGGSGGHNGIKSLDAHLGKDYRRLRIGIGHPGDKARVSGYVLSDFAKADETWLLPLLTAISDCSDMLAKGEDINFSNKLALKLQSNEPPSAKGQSNKAAKHEARPAKGQEPRSKMADLLKNFLKP